MPRPVYPPRHVANYFKSLAFLGIFAALPGLVPAAAAAAGVEIIVTGVRPGPTMVYAALCTRDLTIENCAFRNRQAAAAPSLLFSFPDVPPGRYAAVAFQDLDGNGTLDRTRLGFPKEPFALSRDAGRRHSPTFDQAAVPIGPQGVRFRLALRGIVLRGR
jgi:uncharacterized protein (DUF2141 family)